MDFSKVLKSTKCTCGVQITSKHLKPPFIRVPMPKGFYGGRVKKMLTATCDCGLKYAALLNTGHNSYSVVDLVPLEVEKTKESLEVDEAAETPPEDKNIDIDSLKRAELFALAKKLEISVIATAKNDAIKCMIRDKMVIEETGTEVKET